MEHLVLTDAEFKQIAYIDNAIRNMKTDEQKYAIEKKEHEKRLKKREDLIKQIKKKWATEEKTVFINSCLKRMTQGQLNDAIIEAEQEI